jgi:hypothetical protein
LQRNAKIFGSNGSVTPSYPFLCLKPDELVKSPKMFFFIIPAKADIQEEQLIPDSRLRGSDDLKPFYEAVKPDGFAKSPSAALRISDRHQMVSQCRPLAATKRFFEADPMGRSLQSRNHFYGGVNRRRKVSGSWW